MHSEKMNGVFLQYKFDAAIPDSWTSDSSKRAVIGFRKHGTGRKTDYF
jgi:hypothetical protein